MILRGFMYDVVLKDGEVQKTPRNPGNTSIDQEKLSLSIHKNYLGKHIPDTNIVSSDSSDFIVFQEFVKGGNHVDLFVDGVKNDVKELLDLGEKMQSEQGVFFDVFGMQGMINLFNYYFSDTKIKKISDFLLPISAKYLKSRYRLPPEVLFSMNNDIGTNPFIAYNILRDQDGKLHFIDTDYRPLDVFHPLNMVGNWITKKALNDVKRLSK